jgi:ATP-dependent RNA helicase HelY
MEMSEGDLVSTFNKTLDVMRQVRDMLVKQDPEHHLRYDLQEADKLMRRGVVEMAYTLGFAGAGPTPAEPDEERELDEEPLDPAAATPAEAPSPKRRTTRKRKAPPDE